MMFDPLNTPEQTTIILLSVHLRRCGAGEIDSRINEDVFSDVLNPFHWCFSSATLQLSAGTHRHLHLENWVIYSRRTVYEDRRRTRYLFYRCARLSRNVSVWCSASPLFVPQTRRSLWSLRQASAVTFSQVLFFLHVLQPCFLPPLGSSSKANQSHKEEDCGASSPVGTLSQK